MTDLWTAVQPVLLTALISVIFILIRTSQHWDKTKTGIGAVFLFLLLNAAPSIAQEFAPQMRCPGDCGPACVYAALRCLGSSITQDAIEKTMGWQHYHSGALAGLREDLQETHRVPTSWPSSSSDTTTSYDVWQPGSK